MKSFLTRVFVFACLQMVIVAFVLKNGQPARNNHFFSAMNDKLDRMEKTKQPRLILVGGSSTAFGIDSRQFDSNKYVPINLGIQASLGLNFHLRILEDRIREGDVILLLFEYESLEGRTNETIKLQMATVCPRLAKYLDPTYSTSEKWKRTMDDDALVNAHLWVARAFKGKGHSGFAHEQAPGVEGVYDRRSFNEFGDVVAHVNLPTQPKPVFNPIRNWDEKGLSRNIDRLNEFYRFCEDRGVDVYLSFAPMPQHRFDPSQDALNTLVEYCDRELEIPRLDHPSDHVFDADEFYDSFYHLRGDAIAERTRHLRDSLDARRMAESNSNQGRWR